MQLTAKIGLAMFLLAISHVSAYSQILEKNEANKVVNGSKLIRLDEKRKQIKYIELNPQFPYSDTKETEWLNKSLKLSDKYTFGVIKKNIDKIGIKHTRYQIFYKNIPIEGFVYSVHSKNGKIHSANGEYAINKDISLNHSLKEQDAFEKAIKYVNAKEYKWESDVTMARPIGNLIIVPVDTIFVLAYKIDIYASEPLSRQYIYVDANSGEIIRAINRIHIINVNGTAKTLYNGNVTITTDSYNGSYRLREADRGNGIETYNLNHSTSYSSAIDFTDTDNNWTDTIDYNHAANDAHFATEATYDYYFSQFGRNSYDDNGGKMISYVHYGRNYANAFWDGTCMTYGDGDGYSYKPLTPIEVVAHEITHGVTEHSAGLIYSSESGALNESFSDIFGIVIDFYKNPSTANYLMGDAMSVNHIPFRSMQNPNDYHSPDTYRGLYWDSWEEVHTNSGVQNFWFYLLCEGGSGTNDLGNVFSVNGIGREKAAKIAYRNLTEYLTPSSNYADARFYSIQSAIDLFGDCSAEVIAVTNAWYAVGVGTQYNNSVVADFISSKLNACDVPAKICFYNRSFRALTYSWDFGDGISDTSKNPVHIYQNAGIYTARLIATGNTICNNSDTIDKVFNISRGQSPSASGCIPHTLNPGSGGIYNFRFNSINKTSNGSTDDYQDYTCTDSTLVTEGKKYVISARIGNTNLENIYVWLDLNNDGNFNGIGEKIYERKNVSKNFTDSLIFPATISHNRALRLRVGTDLPTFPLIDACTNSQHGQFEDYTIYVLENLTAPKTIFSSNRQKIVSGDTVQFKDNSLNLPTLWNWSFPGGIPSSSGLKNPKVLYNTPGIYEVRLTSTNLHGSNSVTKTGYITVTTPAPAGLSATIADQVLGKVRLNWYLSNDDNYFEDFDDGIADEFIYSDNIFIVENGYLKLSGTGDNSWKSACLNRNFQDFLLEYKFQQVQGSSYSIGSFIRSDGFLNSTNSNGYLINILPSGSYGVWKFNDGIYTNLIPWSLTSAVNTSLGAWNIVNIEAVGDHIKIYVNSQFVDEFIDNDFSSGKNNLVSYIGQGYNFDIRWDYLNVTSQASLSGIQFTKAVNTTLTGAGKVTEPPKHKLLNENVDVQGLMSQTRADNGVNVFRNYKLYRDSVFYRMTTNTSYTDTLPKYGSYKYFVTSLYDEGESNPTNTVLLKWEELNPGDKCSNAQNLATLTSPFSSSTIGYKSDFTLCNMGYSPDRIFYIDVPKNNILKIGQTYNSFDSRHSIRVGGSCPGAIELVCQDEPDEGLYTYKNISDSTKRIYYILSGYGSSFGNFTLDWNLQAPSIPKADFIASSTFISKGSVVNFSDISTGIPTSWKWSFPGGTPSSSTNQYPSVTYNSLGNYEVKLVSSNNLGTDSIVKTSYITVSNLNYCTSYLGGGNCPGDITSLSIKGTTLNNTIHNLCNSNNGSIYAFYPVNGNTTARLKADSTYEFSITTSSQDIISVWIDYNQNSVFEASEWTQVTVSSVPGVPSNINIVVPPSALNGLTGMRIRTRAWGNSNGASDACSNFGSGITEDYIVTITQTPKKPLANFSAKQKVISGESIQFLDLTSGVPTSWKWKFNGGSPAISTSQNPSVVFNTAGSYDIKLIASNSLGTDSIIKTNYITVTDALPGEECANAQNLSDLTSPYENTTEEYKGDFNFCSLGSSPDRIFYIDVPSGNILKIGQTSNNFDSRHTIRMGGGCPGTSVITCVDDPDDEMYTYINTTSSLQRIYYILGGYSSSSSGNFTLEWHLEAPTLPVADFMASNTDVEMGSYISFTDKTSGIPTSWRWYFQGGSPDMSFSANPTVYYSTPGKYDVKLIASNSLGADSVVKTDYIRVALPPKPVANFSSGSTVVKTGLSVNFYDYSSNSPSSWKWYFTGGTPAVSNSNYPSVVYNSSGIFNVKMVVSNLGGSDSIVKTGYITVTPSQKPVANFNADQTKILKGNSVHFYQNSGNDPSSFKWSFPGGNPSTSIYSDAYITYNTPGTYNVKLVVSNSEGSDSIVKNDYITVSYPPKPVADFYANATEVTPGTSISFQNISTNNPTEIKWIFQGGNPSVSTYYNPYVQYNTIGNYDVKLVVSNSGGKDSITKTAFIKVVATVPGDNCSNAQDLSAMTSPYKSSTTGYKSDFNYCSMGNTPDRIFYIDVPSQYSLRIGQTNNEFDSRHTIRVGGSCPGNTEIFCVDDPDTQMHTYSNTTGTVQRVYYILGGYGYSYGNFTLAWSLISPSTIPIADFTSDNTNIQIGSYVNFMDQSAGNPTSWSWYFPGGSPSYSTYNNPSVYYSNSGNYLVKLRVWNSNGGDSITKNNYITVNPPPKPVALIYSGNTNIKSGSEIYFQDGSSNYPTSRKWTFEGGNPSFSEQNYVNVIYSTPGLYNVKLVVTNSGGTDSIVKIKYVTVVPQSKPMANFNVSNNNPIINSYVSFSDNSGNNPVSWKWTFTGGSPSTSNYSNPSVVYSGTGKYSVKLTVTNAAGSDSITKTEYITVKLPPKPVVNFGASSTTALVGSYVNFYSNATNNPTSLKWYFQGGSPSTSTNSYPNIQYNTAGIYNVKLVATNEGGSDSLIKTAYIKVTIPPKPQAKFNSNYTNITVGSYVYFSNNSTNNPTSLKWVFSGGSPSYSTYSYPSVQYNTVGNYDVKLVASNAGGSDSIIKSAYIKVSLPPKPVVNFYTSSTDVTVGSYVYFYDNSTNNPTTLKWNFSGGSPTSSTYSNPSVQYNATGNYDVKLIASNAGGTDSIIKIAHIKVSLPPKPVAVFTSSSTNVSIGSYVYFYNYSINNPTSIKWSFPGGWPESSTYSHPSVQYNSYGTFNVKLVVSNAGGSDSIVKEDYISVPEPVRDFEADSIETCLNKPVVFKNISTVYGNSYSWDFGNGATPKTANTSGPHTVVYSTSGKKTVSLTIDGFSINKNNYINVESYPQSFSSDARESFCDGKPALFILKGSEISASYQLYKNGLAIGNPKIGTNSPLEWPITDSGNYYVNAWTTSNNSCRSNMPNSIPIRKNASFKLENKISMCQGVEYILPNGVKTDTAGLYSSNLFTKDGCDSIITTIITIKPVPNAPKVKISENKLVSDCKDGNQWYSVENGLILNATANYYEPPKSGNFYNTLTINGCKSISSDIVNFIRTGTDDIFQNFLVFYPNPIADVLYIKSDDEIIINKVEIRNALGNIVQLVQPDNRKAQLFTIDMSMNATGYYTILVYTEDGIITRKIAKLN